MRVLLLPFKLLNQSSALLSDWIIDGWFRGFLAEKCIKGSYVCRSHSLGALCIVSELSLDSFEAFTKRMNFLIEPSLVILLVSQHALENISTVRSILILCLWRLKSCIMVYQAYSG